MNDSYNISNENVDAVILSPKKLRNNGYARSMKINYICV